MHRKKLTKETLQDFSFLNGSPRGNITLHIRYKNPLLDILNERVTDHISATPSEQVQARQCHKIYTANLD